MNIPRILAILPTFALACCAPAPRPVPAPTPPVQAAPPPVAVAAPSYDNWLDAPQTPGDWRYIQEPNETLAAFGMSATDTQFAIVCRRATRMIGLVRDAAGSAIGNQPVPLRILTETAQRTESAIPQPGAPPRLVAQLPARDPLLDAMALSRGRFAIQATGFDTLYLPAWPEVTRVIEDCR